MLDNFIVKDTLNILNKTDNFSDASKFIEPDTNLFDNSLKNNAHRENSSMNENNFLSKNLPQNSISLPNNLKVYYLNKMETDFLYQELFIEEEYAKFGIKIKDNDVIIDVGANIGIFALWANSKAEALNILCFEPVSNICNLLQRNLSRNNVISKIFPFALGEENQDFYFNFYPNATIFSGAENEFLNKKNVIKKYLLNAHLNKMDLGQELNELLLEELLDERLTVQKIKCTMKPLSEVILSERISQIDLLKIDVEGMEQRVLAGITDENWKNIRQVVCEVHNTDGRLKAIENILKTNGFRQIFSKQNSSMKDTNLYMIYAAK